MTAGAPLRIAVLISGSGRSLENLVARIEAGTLRAEIARVISSRPGVRGLDVAAAAGIPSAVISRRDHADVDAFSDALAASLGADEPELIVMAGFLSFFKLPQQLLGRVINIHPSLLPLFGGEGYYGQRVHEAVLQSGVRVSGCTVHFVDNEYDHGAIILQLPCPVAPDDDAESLAARVFARERDALPDAIELIRAGRVAWRDGTAHFGPGATDALGSWFRAAP